MADQNQDSFNFGGMIAFIFSMVVSLGFFVYIAFIHPGVDLKEIPEMEVGADGSQTLAKFDIKSVEKPWEFSEEMAKHGQKVYGQYCVACHGPKGAGDGPAAAGLNPKPRNLIAGGWKQGGDPISLFKTLQNGVNGGATGMAAFKSIDVKERWAIVHYIRSITEDKPDFDEAKLAEFAKGAD